MCGMGWEVDEYRDGLAIRVLWPRHGRPNTRDSSNGGFNGRIVAKAYVLLVWVIQRHTSGGLDALQSFMNEQSAFRKQHKLRTPRFSCHRHRMPCRGSECGVGGEGYLDFLRAKRSMPR